MTKLQLFGPVLVNESLQSMSNQRLQAEQSRPFPMSFKRHCMVVMFEFDQQVAYRKTMLLSFLNPLKGSIERDAFLLGWKSLSHFASVPFVRKVSRIGRSVNPHFRSHVEAFSIGFCSATKENTVHGSSKKCVTATVIVCRWRRPFSKDALSLTFD
jgi:hypothetical protein